MTEGGGGGGESPLEFRALHAFLRYLSSIEATITAIGSFINPQLWIPINVLSVLVVVLLE